jgi:hypothetical protein
MENDVNNLLTPYLSTHTIVDIQRQEIKLYEQLVECYKRDEARLKSVIEAQESLINHMKSMDRTKNLAIEHLRLTLLNAEAIAFPRPRLF